MADAGASIFAELPRVEERCLAAPGELRALLDSQPGPFVVRGLVADWPLVEAGRQSARTARDYLLGKSTAAPLTLHVGRTDGDERLFYDDAYGMNFETARGRLDEIFVRFDAREDAGDGPSLYLTSIDMRTFFRGLAEDNPSPVAGFNPLESIWIGTNTRVAAHNDFPRNLACCAVGKRRFTIFPPDQFANLYLGPIENTPAGRPVSMVDFHDPDMARFPRFAEALPHAQVAELEPGDAIYLPSMWWHHVEGLAPFNVLVNYWWRDTPAYLGQPQEALNHALLAIRDLPESERAIWRDLFEHYVFAPDDGVTAHLPPEARGILAPLTAESAGRIRSFLLRTLNR